ncbi:MAG: stage III sporulation protein AF [Lachnospiraceae bacterium]|nr:stage III sporulation protein AF [Lachnospiraceae bacterium]MBQ8547334.1 stage III sporulation protein AF [Lachnospiraceae bacterium]
MMGDIISYAKTVLFFLLFVNLIMQLLKGSSYERFVHPVCGMILVIMIIRPLLSLFGGEEKVLYAAEQKLSLLLSGDEMRLSLPKEAGYEFAVLEAYEEELVTQLSGILAEDGLAVVNADFSLSAEEADFGTIRGLTLTAEQKREGNTSRIEIAPIVFGEKESDKTVSAEEIRIKDKLADFYRLDEDNIYVSIKEEKNG